MSWYKGTGGDIYRNFGGALKRRDQFFLEIAKLAPRSAFMLDAGCGSAYLAVQIAKKRTDVSFVCTDYDWENLEVVRNVLASVGFTSRFRLIHCSAELIPVEDGLFDYAMACAVIPYCQNPIKAVKGLYTKLKVGGKLRFDITTKPIEALREKENSLKWVKNFHYFDEKDICVLEDISGLIKCEVEGNIRMYEFERTS